MTKADIETKIAENKKEMRQWIDQIVPITIDVRMASLNEDWVQVKHFVNLITYNIKRINELSEAIKASKEQLANIIEE